MRTLSCMNIDRRHIWMLKFGFGLFLSPWKFVQRGNGIRTVGATEFATWGGSLVTRGLCRGCMELI